MWNNKLTRWLFSIVYYRWLGHDFYKCQANIIKVKGWRTALVNWGSQRNTITICFGKFE